MRIRHLEDFRMPLHAQRELVTATSSHHPCFLVEEPDGAMVGVEEMAGGADDPGDGVLERLADRI